jgi:SWI/SNF-related matrix-associated actin-dependent regulator of chromatin subfamily A containing DEAD/H box 1
MKGLGKTCQAIALLAYLYEKNPRLKHLIVVPASTLENWSRELKNWFPDFKFEIYRGHPTERRAQRIKLKPKLNKNNVNGILTTYE